MNAAVQLRLVRAVGQASRPTEVCASNKCCDFRDGSNYCQHHCTEVAIMLWTTLRFASHVSKDARQQAHSEFFFVLRLHLCAVFLGASATWISFSDVVVL